MRVVAAPAAPLRREPLIELGLESELLHGETFRVFETKNGWAWGQNQSDGYVGYVPASALGPTGPEPTHRITALRTPVYSEPDVRKRAVSALPLGALVAVAGTAETRGRPYLLLDGGGAIVAAHAAPLAAPRGGDFVAVAERFINCPYLWGGRTSLGLDCSALVQLALAETGIAAPRDSYMQQVALGAETKRPATRRGDLIFWPGHVAIVAGPERLVHASGHHMLVVSEPLAPALERIGKLSGAPVFRRLAGGAEVRRRGKGREE